MSQNGYRCFQQTVWLMFSWLDTGRKTLVNKLYQSSLVVDAKQFPLVIGWNGVSREKLELFFLYKKDQTKISQLD